MEVRNINNFESSQYSNKLTSDYNIANNDFQSLANFITERFDNIEIDESNNYL